MKASVSRLIFCREATLDGLQLYTDFFVSVLVAKDDTLCYGTCNNSCRRHLLERDRTDHDPGRYHAIGQSQTANLKKYNLGCKWLLMYKYQHVLQLGLQQDSDWV